MRILVINSGSSSVKFQVIDMNNESVLCKGLIERIGEAGGSRFRYSKGDNPPVIHEDPVPDHLSAVRLLLDEITSADNGIICSLNEISAVGHRLVHGGESIREAVLVTPDVIELMEQNASLAPLHNPPGLTGVKAVRELLPGVPNVGSFDTAYYSGMTPESYLFGLAYDCYERYGIRKFGFHGASHRYVNLRAADLLGIPRGDFRSVSCHMGNGVSITASIGCRAVDTSLGLGTMCGVPMGTRAGDVDPDAILTLIEKHGFSPAEVRTLIYKKSGLLGLSGISNDMRDLRTAADGGNERAALAVSLFARAARKQIGALASCLEGRMDALIFTAGIGENSASTRKDICKGLQVLGIKLDDKKNSTTGSEIIISAPDSAVNVCVIPTNEELMIARETMEITESLKGELNE